MKPSRSIVTGWRKRIFRLAAAFVLMACCGVASQADELVTLNTRDTGYRGIWYHNQPLRGPYRFKYSGGLGTYCAKHQPFAVYCREVEKTFFCYGGVDGSTTKPSLLHLVSYYDHKAGEVPRPVVVLDKKTRDAHDNPVIAVDRGGHVWIFSTSHGTSRPSYIHRSVKPHDISRFKRIDATQSTDAGPVPITNFSYMQAWTMTDGGFVYFFTRYEVGRRVLRFAESPDGVAWSRWQRLASVEEGHYQISGVHRGRAASVFNMHPRGKGLNWRTNLYYIETPDRGKSWRTVDGKPIALPLTEKDNPALVHDYQRDGLLVYLKDLTFDEAGRPIILFLTSRGYAPGPENGPRTWRVARWTGRQWRIAAVTESDSNYDMGSIHAEHGGELRIIGPTETGPQSFNPGGEVVLWSSTDGGDTWHRIRSLTSNSRYNHTYVRRPVRAHPDFQAFWADGHGREPSPSRLYFANRDGQVYRLPESMAGETARPELIASEDGGKPAVSSPVATIDLDGQTHRQVVVDREAGQYLGHPTTCLLEDGKTILCVYPKGHGRGAIVYKRSADGGRTWSDRLPTPASWATSKEVPTLHRVVGPDGTKRIIMWSGLHPARLAVTEDDGVNWSELKPVGDWGGIVVMGFVEALNTGPGRYMAMFHDDGRFFAKEGKRTSVVTLYETFSKDGGLTWSFPEEVHRSSQVHLCEPGCIRSPDGKRLAVLLRENSRRKNSHVIFSNDEGKTWTEPRELPLALTGDRHTAKYGPDGRLFVSFRCISPTSKREKRLFEGDWVGWVGTWDDIVHGRDGQYVVRLKDNTKSYDTSYPGVEVLPDGTFVATTYGHWDRGEAPYILSVRLRLEELDALVRGRPR